MNIDETYDELLQEDLEDPEILYQIAMCLWEGDGVAIDREKAKQYLDEAVSMGSVEAKQFIDGIQESEESQNQEMESEEARVTLPPISAATFKLWMKRSIEGDPEAICEVAEYQFALKRDTPEECERNLRQAAEDNSYGRAWYLLGEHYEKKDFPDGTLTKAFDCYVNAAELGEAEAYGKVSESYLRGENGEIDIERADYWKKQQSESALKEKNIPLIITIINQYMTGKGASQSTKEAYRMLLALEEFGDEGRDWADFYFTLDQTTIDAQDDKILNGLKSSGNLLIKQALELLHLSGLFPELNEDMDYTELGEVGIFQTEELRDDFLMHLKPNNDETERITAITDLLYPFPIIGEMLQKRVQGTKYLSMSQKDVGQNERSTDTQSVQPFALKTEWLEEQLAWIAHSDLFARLNYHSELGEALPMISTQTYNQYVDRIYKQDYNALLIVAVYDHGLYKQNPDARYEERLRQVIAYDGKNREAVYFLGEYYLSFKNQGIQKIGIQYLSDAGKLGVAEGYELLCDYYSSMAPNISMDLAQFNKQKAAEIYLRNSDTYHLLQDAVWFLGYNKNNYTEKIKAYHLISELKTISDEGRYLGELANRFAVSENAEPQEMLYMIQNMISNPIAVQIMLLLAATNQFPEFLPFLKTRETTSYRGVFSSLEEKEAFYDQVCDKDTPNLDDEMLAFSLINKCAKTWLLIPFKTLIDYETSKWYRAYQNVTSTFAQPNAVTDQEVMSCFENYFQAYPNCKELAGFYTIAWQFNNQSDGNVRFDILTTSQNSLLLQYRYYLCQCQFRMGNSGNTYLIGELLPELRIEERDAFKNEPGIFANYIDLKNCAKIFTAIYHNYFPKIDTILLERYKNAERRKGFGLGKGLFKRKTKTQKSK